MPRTSVKSARAFDQHSLVRRDRPLNHVSISRALNVLEDHRVRAFNSVDRAFIRLMTEARRRVHDETAHGVDGCTRASASPSEIEAFPIEAWVGAAIFVLANNGFLMQLRENKPGVLNPSRICNFGGKLELDEPPAHGLVREFADEFRHCDILEHALIDELRVYSTTTQRGVVVRCVFDVIIPETPSSMQIGEGSGHLIIVPNQVPRIVAMTDLSREDAQLSMQRGDFRVRYAHGTDGPSPKRGGYLDEFFGGESDEPFDQF